MKILIEFALVAFVLMVRIAHASASVQPVALPAAEGFIAGCVFSPDSNHLAIIRNVVPPDALLSRRVLQTVDLRTGQEEAHADVLSWEPAYHSASPHMIVYSPDGHYLLVATEGSDILSIFDATTLQALKQITLHPDARTILGPVPKYFRGAVGLVASGKADRFGVVTHNELEDNEAFIGSFTSEQIIRRWSLGRGRTGSALGSICLSLSDDGLTAVVPLLPHGNAVQRDVQNLRLYDLTTGATITSIKTTCLVRETILVARGYVLTSCIDAHGIFSKKACIEQWSFKSGKLIRQFCDPGRNVSGPLSASVVSGRVVGFAASHFYRTMEGHLYGATGHIDIWEMGSGSLLASSTEIPQAVKNVRISSSGEWVMADGMLLRIKGAP